MSALPPAAPRRRQEEAADGEAGRRRYSVGRAREVASGEPAGGRAPPPAANDVIRANEGQDNEAASISTDEEEEVELVSSGDELDGSVCSCCCAGDQQQACGVTSKRGSRVSCALEAHRNSIASSTGCCAHHQDAAASPARSACGQQQVAGPAEPGTRARPPAATDCDGDKNETGPGGSDLKSTGPGARLALAGARDHLDEHGCDEEYDNDNEIEIDARRGLDRDEPIVSQPVEPTTARDSGRDTPDAGEQERQEREAALVKRRYVLTELVETERDYVSDLGKIVEGYLEEIRRQLVDSGVADILTTGVVPSQQSAVGSPPVAGGQQPGAPATGGAEPGAEQPAGQEEAHQQHQQAPQSSPSSGQQQEAACQPKLPDALKDGKHKIIFGNVEAIYEFHRDHFLLELERCLEEPSRLGPLFKRYERRLNMYVVYCQNKPRSEAVVSEHLDTYFEVSNGEPLDGRRYARARSHSSGLWLGGAHCAPPAGPWGAPLPRDGGAPGPN